MSHNHQAHQHSVIFILSGTVATLFVHHTQNISSTLVEDKSLLFKSIVPWLSIQHFALIIGIPFQQNLNVAPLHTIKFSKLYSLAHITVSFSITQLQSLQSHKMSKIDDNFIFLFS